MKESAFIMTTVCIPAILSLLVSLFERQIQTTATWWHSAERYFLSQNVGASWLQSSNHVQVQLFG